MHAHHLILSYSHEIDLALCTAALTRGFASCGPHRVGGEMGDGSGRGLASWAIRMPKFHASPAPCGDPSWANTRKALPWGVAGRLLKEHLHKESAAKPVRRGKVTRT